MNDLSKLMMVKSIAEELVSVQPMPANAFSELMKVAESRKELEESGYKPVSNIGLLWIKK